MFEKWSYYICMLAVIPVCSVQLYTGHTVGTTAIQWTVWIRVHCYYCGCRLSGIVVAHIPIIYKALCTNLYYVALLQVCEAGSKCVDPLSDHLKQPVWRYHLSLKIWSFIEWKWSGMKEHDLTCMGCHGIHIVLFLFRAICIQGCMSAVLLGSPSRLMLRWPVSSNQPSTASLTMTSAATILTMVHSSLNKRVYILPFLPQQNPCIHIREILIFY